jgi:hypothetical protein
LILFFAHLFFFVDPSFAVESSLIGADDIAELAFPQATVLKRNRLPTSVERDRIHNIWGIILDQAGRFSEVWAPAYLGHDYKKSDLARIQENLKKVPFYLCIKDECLNCRGRKASCLQTRSVRGLLAGAFFISEKLLLKRDGGRSLYEQLALGYFDYVQSYAGLSELKDKDPKNIALTKSKEAFMAAQESSIQLLKTCSGAISLSGHNFLKKAGIFHSINEYWNACGQKYLEMLDALSLQVGCEFLKGRPRVLDFGRCEETCELLTCGSSSKPVPRLILLSGNLALGSLPPEACEGSLPVQAEAFLRYEVGQLAKNPQQKAKCLKNVNAGPVEKKEAELLDVNWLE